MIPDSAQRAARFVELHRGDDLFVMGNPTTVGVAVTLEQMGYLALGTSSAALARSMGRTDGTRSVRRSEAIAHAAEMAAATSVPISGDFEHGYGDDPSEVAETVRASIEAGLAGCCVEDATGRGHGSLYDMGLAVERVSAGAEAMGDHPFVFVARTENHLHGVDDLDDTIARLQSFEAAGASAVYAPGLITLDQIRRVVESVDVPVNVLVGLPGQTFTLDDLGEIGVRRVSVGSGFERVGNAALQSCAQRLLAGAGPVSELFG